MKRSASRRRPFSSFSLRRTHRQSGELRLEAILLSHPHICRAHVTPLAPHARRGRFHLRDTAGSPSCTMRILCESSSTTENMHANPVHKTPAFKTHPSQCQPIVVVDLSPRRELGRSRRTSRRFDCSPRRSAHHLCGDDGKQKEGNGWRRQQQRLLQLAARPPPTREVSRHLRHRSEVAHSPRRVHVRHLHERLTRQGPGRRTLEAPPGWSLTSRSRIRGLVRRRIWSSLAGPVRLKSATGATCCRL